MQYKFHPFPAPPPPPLSKSPSPRFKFSPLKCFRSFGGKKSGSGWEVSHHSEAKGACFSFSECICYEFLPDPSAACGWILS